MSSKFSFFKPSAVGRSLAFEKRDLSKRRRTGERLVGQDSCQGKCTLLQTENDNQITIIIKITIIIIIYRQLNVKFMSISFMKWVLGVQCPHF